MDAFLLENFVTTARICRRWRAASSGLLALTIALVSARATTQTQTPADAIRLRVEQLRQQPATATIRGSRLKQPEAVARFFEMRAFAPAWKLPGAAQQALTAIRNIEQDGLTPADYHLAAIAAAIDAYAKSPSNDTSADLELLMADAAAAMVDHVRYG